jgi:hypothetical protein
MASFTDMQPKEAWVSLELDVQKTQFEGFHGKESQKAMG